MPCSICHQCGHNKRTCPNVLITFKEVEAKPHPRAPLTIEGALTLLCRDFQLPEEVEKLISKQVFWGDYKPNFLSFTCSPNEWVNEDYIVARREGRCDWETQDDPRYNSILNAAQVINATGNAYHQTEHMAYITIQAKTALEHGDGNSAGKKHQNHYYETLFGIVEGKALIYEPQCREFLKMALSARETPMAESARPYKRLNRFSWQGE